MKIKFEQVTIFDYIYFSLALIFIVSDITFLHTPSGTRYIIIFTFLISAAIYRLLKYKFKIKK